MVNKIIINKLIDLFRFFNISEVTTSAQAVEKLKTISSSISFDTVKNIVEAHHLMEIIANLNENFLQTFDEQSPLFIQQFRRLSALIEPAHKKLVSDGVINLENTESFLQNEQYPFSRSEKRIQNHEDMFKKQFRHFMLSVRSEIEAVNSELDFKYENDPTGLSLTKAVIAKKNAILDSWKPQIFRQLQHFFPSYFQLLNKTFFDIDEQTHNGRESGNALAFRQIRTILDSEHGDWEIVFRNKQALQIFKSISNCSINRFFSHELNEQLMQIYRLNEISKFLVDKTPINFSFVSFIYFISKAVEHNIATFSTQYQSLLDDPLTIKPDAFPTLSEFSQNPGSFNFDALSQEDRATPYFQILKQLQEAKKFQEQIENDKESYKGTETAKELRFTEWNKEISARRMQASKLLFSPIHLYNLFKQNKIESFLSYSEDLIVIERLRKLKRTYDTIPDSSQKQRILYNACVEFCFENAVKTIDSNLPTMQKFNKIFSFPSTALEITPEQYQIFEKIYRRDFGVLMPELKSVITRLQLQLPKITTKKLQESFDLIQQDTQLLQQGKNKIAKEDNKLKEVSFIVKYLNYIALNGLNTVSFTENEQQINPNNFLKWQKFICEFDDIDTTQIIQSRMQNPSFLSMVAQASNLHRSGLSDNSSVHNERMFNFQQSLVKIYTAEEEKMIKVTKQQTLLRYRESKIEAYKKEIASMNNFINEQFNKTFKKFIAANLPKTNDEDIFDQAWHEYITKIVSEHANEVSPVIVKKIELFITRIHDISAKLFNPEIDTPYEITPKSFFEILCSQNDIESIDKTYQIASSFVSSHQDSSQIEKVRSDILRYETVHETEHQQNIELKKQFYLKRYTEIFKKILPIKDGTSFGNQFFQINQQRFEIDMEEFGITFVEFIVAIDISNNKTVTIPKEILDEIQSTYERNMLVLPKTTKYQEIMNHLNHQKIFSTKVIETATGELKTQTTIDFANIPCDEDFEKFLWYFKFNLSTFDSTDGQDSIPAFVNISADQPFLIKLFASYHKMIYSLIPGTSEYNDANPGLTNDQIKERKQQFLSKHNQEHNIFAPGHQHQIVSPRNITVESIEELIHLYDLFINKQMTIVLNPDTPDELKNSALQQIFAIKLEGFDTEAFFQQSQVIVEDTFAKEALDKKHEFSLYRARKNAQYQCQKEENDDFVAKATVLNPELAKYQEKTVSIISEIAQLSMQILAECDEKVTAEKQPIPEDTKESIKASLEEFLSADNSFKRSAAKRKIQKIIDDNDEIDVKDIVGIFDERISDIENATKDIKITLEIQIIHQETSSQQNLNRSVFQLQPYQIEELSTIAHDEQEALSQLPSRLITGEVDEQGKLVGKTLQQFSTEILLIGSPVIAKPAGLDLQVVRV